MTTSSSSEGLIERLRQGVLIIGHEPGQPPMLDDVTASQAMRKAADRLEALEAENADLREARRISSEFNEQLCARLDAVIAQLAALTPNDGVKP